MLAGKHLAKLEVQYRFRKVEKAGGEGESKAEQGEGAESGQGTEVEETCRKICL